MSPSGGDITLVDQPMTWSPLNRIPLSREGEAEMVRGVAGSVNGLEAPALTGDGLAIVHCHIRDEVPVPAFFDPGLTALPSGMRAITVCGGAGCRLKCCGRRRMVTMGVGDQDVGHSLARETGEQGLDMLREVGTGVDYRNLAVADDVGAGTSEREGAGVACDDAADPRCDWLEPAVLERKLTAEGYVDGHDSETTRDPPPAPEVSVIILETAGG